MYMSSPMHTSFHVQKVPLSPQYMKLQTESYLACKNVILKKTNRKPIRTLPIFHSHKISGGGGGEPSLNVHRAVPQ